MRHLQFGKVLGPYYKPSNLNVITIIDKNNNCKFF